MLYSLAANVAFAHYPKTAGSAIAEWFRRVFPDARYVKAGHPHVDVRRSLAWLSGGRSLPPVARLRYLTRASNWRLPLEPRPELPHTIRILGVVREPLDMLASLYEYWRRGEANPDSRDRFVTAAWDGRFADFVGQAIGGRLPSYAAFFDAGGPAWPNTRLVHFADVEEGLARACREFGLGVTVELPRKNCGPAGGRRLDRPDVEAQHLTAELRRHFAWYHDTYGHADHPAARRRSPARLAA
ncbi:MAG: hypothetical protein ACKO1M_00990 [Planctomycetota bacterium]